MKLADLQYKAEYVLVDELNPRLRDAGLRRVDHVSDVVHQLEDDDINPAKKHKLRTILVEVFERLTGSSDDAKAAIEQWPEVMSWHRRRVAFAHPLGDGVVDEGKLRNLKAQVTSEEVYAPVRCAAKVLIAAAERVISP